MKAANVQSGWISAAAAAAIAFCLAAPAEARFAHKETRQVPIDRLVKNLEFQRTKQLVNSLDRAMIDFKIGRLHAMAYALKSEVGKVEAEVRPGSTDELPDFGYTPDHVQFQVDPCKDPSKNARAQKHLQAAIKSLETAAQTNPSFLPAKLGLAWCLDQQGNKTQALKLYREVFNEAYETEKTSKGGMYDWSITLETSEYLQHLLDPVKDKKEIAGITEKTNELNKLPRYVTPILVPLDRHESSLADLLVNRKVEFDLDGRGKKTYYQWTSPKAGWLVYDPFSTGQISSGLQFIGSVSFWIFWRDGYEVLTSLDDNHDKVLSGSELKGLSVWHDADGNARSDAGEVKPLDAWGIVELSTAVSKREAHAITNLAGLRFRCGHTAPTYDVILSTKPQAASDAVVKSQARPQQQRTGLPQNTRTKPAMPASPI